MPTTMSQKIVADVTTVNKGAAIALNSTPLLGGAGKRGILRCPVLPLTSTVLIQGAPLRDPATNAAPAAASALWTTIATITSASEEQQEIDLPANIRYNTTVLDADGPNVNFYVETTP